MLRTTLCTESMISVLSVTSFSGYLRRTFYYLTLRSARVAFALRTIRKADDPLWPTTSPLLFQILFGDGTFIPWRTFRNIGSMSLCFEVSVVRFPLAN
jgi:hypothetical protein